MIFPAVIGRLRSKIRSRERDNILGNPRRMLLVKQAERLGNIVLLNAAISALKNAFPDLEIDLLLPAKYHEIMEDDQRIGTIIPVYKKVYITRPWRLLKLINILRRRKYDMAVDCSDVNSHSSTGASYTLLSGARITAGWDTGSFFDIKDIIYHITGRND